MMAYELELMVLKCGIKEHTANEVKQFDFNIVCLIVPPHACNDHAVKKKYITSRLSQYRI